MKSLEQEAEEYSESYDECDIWIQGVAKECYIAGVNSPWVKFEKIKAQIDILHDVRNLKTLRWVDAKIDELEQQLKRSRK
jgi:hypothetical protein